MKYIKKYWFIIIVILITIIRFLYSYKIPSFYLTELHADDNLMISQFQSLIENNYLGSYTSTTLIKGIVYPLSLVLSHTLHMSYSSFFTILYILSCIYFVLSLKKIINNKIFILITYIILLFNPLSYSIDLFQRLYRNSLSIIELLFFLGTIIRIIVDKKNNIFNYISLGIIISLMYLTREDNIWIIPILIFIFIYKIYKNVKVKNILINLIPIFILVLSLNVVSYINYRHYGIYTYNEIKESNFKKAYINLLSIKEDKKYDKVAINKETFYKIIDNSDILGFDKEYIDREYRIFGNKDGQIENNNIVWFFRRWIYAKHNFKNGKEANEYFKELNKEINRLFKEGKLEKEKIIPSVLINTPTYNEIKKIPKAYLDTIIYTSTYKGIKTMDSITIKDKIEAAVYNYDTDAYMVIYRDYPGTDQIIKNNPIKYEIFRLMYKYLTIIFSLISLIIYFMNIKKFDSLGIIINILLLSYLIIISGIVYTHTTGYYAIRYFYLGNIYIIQSLFIMLNIYRYIEKKK